MPVRACIVAAYDKEASMLYLQGKFMKATELAARGDYPPSHLVTVFDEETADTLNLICDATTFAALPRNTRPNLTEHY
jgi:hypothetical protein